MGGLTDERNTDGRRLAGGGQELLQTLVGIRLRTVTDPESVRHLTWLSDMIAALGLIQRRLPAEGPADFSAYLDDAAGFWSRACAGRPIRLEARGADADLPDSHVLPLAMITHELIANAVRHAFPDGRAGTVTVAFSRATDGVSLVVRDSGVGADELATGDGLSLVRGLVEHLGGAMTVETAPGAGVGVRIRLPLEAARGH